MVLLDARPAEKKDNELQVQYTGRKALLELVSMFEKRNSSDILSIWSEDSYKQMVKTFFSLHETVEAAGGVVFNEHGEILFIHRNGRWDLPKGKICDRDRPKTKQGKSARTGKSGYGDIDDQAARKAALREVSEETGLKNLKISSELPCTYHIYFDGDRKIIKHTRWFRMEGSTEDFLSPQIAEGIIIARWIPVNSLGCIFLHTYESLKPLIQSVLAFT